MKKICIIGPALKMGGMERASVNLANSISDLGYPVVFVSMFRSKHFFKLNNGIVLHEPDGFNQQSLSILKTIFWLRKVIKETDPTSVLAFSKFYAALAALSLLFTKYPLFLSERSSPFFVWKKKLAIINKVAFTLRPPAGIIAQTRVAAEYQQKYYQKNVRCVVIPNALREVAVYPQVTREKWILAVGRFGDHLKGFDRLIEAYAKIPDNGWKLVFAGGDEDGQYLKDIAAKLNILDRILFLGQIADIDEVFSRAGIFVIPSRSEGFPNALCEAMAASVPSISFDFVAGPRDIITDGTDGILVTDGDTDKLAAAILDLIADEQKRNQLSKNALGIRERLHKDTIARKVVDFLL